MCIINVKHLSDCPGQDMQDSSLNKYIGNMEHKRKMAAGISKHKMFEVNQITSTHNTFQYEIWTSVFYGK